MIINKEDFKNAINVFLKDNNNKLFYCNAGVKSVNGNVIKVEVKDDNINIKKNELGRVNEITFGLTNDLVRIPNDYDVVHKEKYTIEY